MAQPGLDTWRPEKVLYVGLPATRDWLDEVLNRPSEPAFPVQSRSTWSRIRQSITVFFIRPDEHTQKSIVIEPLLNQYADPLETQLDDYVIALEHHYQVNSISILKTKILGNFDPTSAMRYPVVWDEQLFLTSRERRALRLGPQTQPNESSRAAGENNVATSVGCSCPPRNSSSGPPDLETIFQSLRLEKFPLLPLTFVIISSGNSTTKSRYLQLGADLIVDPTVEPEWILLDRLQANARKLKWLAEQVTYCQVIKNAWIFLFFATLGAFLGEFAASALTDWFSSK